MNNNFHLVNITAHHDADLSCLGKDIDDFFIDMLLPIIPNVGDEISFLYHEGLCDKDKIPMQIQSIAIYSGFDKTEGDLVWPEFYERILMIKRRIIEPDNKICLYCIIQ